MSADIGRKSFIKLVREAVKDRIVPDDEVELLYRVFGEMSSAITRFRACLQGGSLPLPYHDCLHQLYL